MGIGVDIVDLNRINIDSDHFVRRILTDREFEVYSRFSSNYAKREYLGGRFAAKEAYMKACGLGIGQISFQDIEVLNHESGAPYLNDPQALVSISHEKDYAIAFVIKT